MASLEKLKIGKLKAELSRWEPSRMIPPRRGGTASRQRSAIKRGHDPSLRGLIFCRPLQDNHSIFKAMRIVSVNAPISSMRRAYTLLELLVTITVIAALCSLILPAWQSVKRSRSRQAALTITMESLERARIAAITGKKDTWVVFRHRKNPPVGRQGNDRCDAIRIIEKERENISPIATWQPLPAGTAFDSSANTLMAEPPPGDILLSAVNGNAPGDVTFGSIMFLRSGKVGLPRPGGNGLTLGIVESPTGSPSDSRLASLHVSRATGRASLE